jgi:hypothetical protein
VLGFERGLLSSEELSKRRSEVPIAARNDGMLVGRDRAVEVSRERHRDHVICAEVIVCGSDSLALKPSQNPFIAISFITQPIHKRAA